MRSAPSCTDQQIIAALVPCLQLVAPAAWDADTQDTWFEAALVALQGVPQVMIEGAARYAMSVADHPSKIVPAMHRHIAGERDRERIASLNRIERPVAQLVHKPAPVPHEETQAILAEARRRAADNRA